MSVMMRCARHLGKLIVAVGVVAAAGPVWAVPVRAVSASVPTVKTTPAQATAMVEDAFNALSTFQADFVQTVTARSGATTEQSRGTFTFRRGEGRGQFLWQYETPVRQKIVGTGTAVYYVDQRAKGGRDGQVTQLPLDAGLGRLLRGQTLKLAAVKLRVDTVRAAGTAWDITLLPVAGTRGDANGLARIVITLDRTPTQGSRILRGFAATDVMGATTTVRFDNVVRGGAVAPGVFRFEPGVYQNKN